MTTFGAESAHTGGTGDQTGDRRGQVVVGVDGSEGSREALRYAAEVARWRGWTLHIVSAWHVSYPVGPYSAGLSELDAAMQQATEEMVAKMRADVLGPDPGIEIDQTVCEGAPSQLLIGASDDADLLVVGSRGRGGFASMALGSVGQACVHHAHCPVLIIRPPRHKVAA